jgi:hypothetical protein
VPRRRRRQQGLERVLGAPAQITNIVAILIIPLIVVIHG